MWDLLCTDVGASFCPWFEHTGNDVNVFSLKSKIKVGFYLFYEICIRDKMPVQGIIG